MLVASWLAGQDHGMASPDGGSRILDDPIVRPPTWARRPDMRLSDDRRSMAKANARRAKY